jgi:hypothetical protein
MPAAHRCSTRRSPGAERPVSVPLCTALAAQRRTSSPASRPTAALDQWKWGLRSPRAGQADVGRAPVCEDAQSELESDAHVRDARGPDCPAPQPPSGLPPFAEREEGGMGRGGGRGGGGMVGGSPCRTVSHAARDPVRHVSHAARPGRNWESRYSHAVDTRAGRCARTTSPCAPAARPPTCARSTCRSSTSRVQRCAPEGRRAIRVLQGTLGYILGTLWGILYGALGYSMRPRGKATVRFVVCCTCCTLHASSHCAGFHHVARRMRSAGCRCSAFRCMACGRS